MKVEDKSIKHNDLVFTRKASGMVKGLSWRDIFISVISAPAGSGILYYSVSTASTYPGGNVALSFFIGMFLVLPVIYLAAISGNVIPRSGSLYVLISRVISPEIGFFTAVLFFIGYTLSIGVVAFVVAQVVGGIFVNAGMAGNLVGLKAVGESLQRPEIAALGGAILVFLTWFLVLKGIRAFKQTMRILFLVTLTSALFAIAYFLMHSGNELAQLFNHTWGEHAFEDILRLARENGWEEQGHVWASTLNLLLVVLFSYAGLELISYASGEVQIEQRKVFRSYMSASIALAFLYILLAYSVQSSFGQFIGAYDFMVKNHPDVLKTIMPVISPSMPFYISSILPNPWIGIIVSLGLTAWFVNTMVPYFFAPSRLLFALAMDRAVPESIANVSAGTGAPTTASHITLCFALLGVIFNFFNVGTVLGTILFCAVFAWWLYGLSAVVLPYRRPNLYSRITSKSEVLGLPLVSLVGTLVFAIGWFVILIAVRQMTMDIVLTLSVIAGLAMLGYSRMMKRNSSKGILVEQIYGQIPPE